MGVGLHCENVGSKIVGDGKIVLYCERSVFVLRFDKFFVENKGIDTKYFVWADRGRQSATFPLFQLSKSGGAQWTSWKQSR